MQIDEATYKRMPPHLQSLFVQQANPGKQMVLELFPETTTSKRNPETCGGVMNNAVYGRYDRRCYENTHGDNGSAARFYYVAKASKRERGEGNSHATVKPLALMEYLVKLVKMPEYNLILDPFMGSGTTLLACIRLGIPCIGIDNDEHSCEIAARRCSQGVLSRPIEEIG